MSLNTEKLHHISSLAVKKREQYQSKYSGIDRTIMEVEYDESRPLITNRKQLEMIGVDCSNLENNLEEVVFALSLLGVKVLYKSSSRSGVAKKLSKALDEEVPAMWGLDNVYEVLFITASDESAELN